MRSEVIYTFQNILGGRWTRLRSNRGSVYTFRSHHTKLYLDTIVRAFDCDCERVLLELEQEGKSRVCQPDAVVDKLDSISKLVNWKKEVGQRVILAAR